jgi:hyperosmotically inducible periplasmic protein
VNTRAARLGRLLLGLMLVLAGCATLDPLEDTRIEAEVKARLVDEKDANLTRIGVLSSNGTVYLSGTVESGEARANAETLAKGVSGVTRVVNTLDVRPAP